MKQLCVTGRHWRVEVLELPAFYVEERLPGVSPAARYAQYFAQYIFKTLL